VEVRVNGVTKATGLLTDVIGCATLIPYVGSLSH